MINYPLQYKQMILLSYKHRIINTHLEIWNKVDVIPLLPIKILVKHNCIIALFLY